MNQPNRVCQTCGQRENDHYTHGPNGALGLGHPFVVRPGDEWCDDHDDWLVNCRCDEDDVTDEADRDWGRPGRSG